MKRIKLHLTALTACLAISGLWMPATASTVADEQDYDESIRLPVRRLHPERNQKNTEKTDNNANADDFSQRMRRERARLQRQNAKSANSGSDAAAQQSSTVDKDWLNQLLSTDYSIKGIDHYKPQRLRWTDEPVKQSTSQLLPYFVSTPVDNGITRYMPKGVTMDNSFNSLYLYFDSSNGKPTDLRLRAQYYADDALDIEQVDFVINGFKYNYVPQVVNRGKGNGRMVWENFDEAVSAPMKDLVYALTHGQAVVVKYVGSRGFSHVKELTADEINDMYRTLELYRAMGGSI